MEFDGFGATLGTNSMLNLMMAARDEGLLVAYVLVGRSEYE